jgi:hypothetical protein
MRLNLVVLGAICAGLLALTSARADDQVRVSVPAGIDAPTVNLLGTNADLAAETEATYWRGGFYRGGFVGGGFRGGFVGGGFYRGGFVGGGFYRGGFGFHPRWGGGWGGGWRGGWGVGWGGGWHGGWGGGWGGHHPGFWAISCVPDATVIVPTMPRIVEPIVPAPQTLPLPSPKEGTFDYDGGPKTQAPIQVPTVQTKPMIVTDFVVVAEKAPSSNTKLSYPAYGQKSNSSNSRDEEVLVLPRR